MSVPQAFPPHVSPTGTSHGAWSITVRAARQRTGRFDTAKWVMRISVGYSFCASAEERAQTSACRRTLKSGPDPILSIDPVRLSMPKVAPRLDRPEAELLDASAHAPRAHQRTTARVPIRGVSTEC